MHHLISSQLLDWYDTQGRKTLPWRHTITPYRVWISEIMLQQTQVKTVMPYFERFMTRFPTIQALATAHEDEVLHLWTGLGYYARARNLHRTAQKIAADYKSIFPDTLEGLLFLPGIGRSTASAILSIAFDQRMPILDGNVRRILARVHVLAGVPTDKAYVEKLWKIADIYTPTKRAGDYAQAIMDLGATICTRTKPLCEKCPISSDCQAYIQGLQSEFPTVKKQKQKPVRSVYMLIVHDTEENTVLLEKRPPVGIWGGLWSFPECSVEENIQTWCGKHLSISALDIEELPLIRHIFTHFVLNIIPIYINRYRDLDRVAEGPDKTWYNLKYPIALGLASPIQKLLESISGFPKK